MPFDAWFRHADLFDTGIGMQLGQFQISDLMFPRETRLLFQDFMVYRMAGITYDRGVFRGLGGVRPGARTGQRQRHQRQPQPVADGLKSPGDDAVPEKGTDPFNQLIIINAHACLHCKESWNQLVFEHKDVSGPLGSKCVV